MGRFRRALYHVAFNMAALRRGAEWALDTANNPVRSYIRRPRKGEHWTFVQIGHGEPVTTRFLSIVPIDLKGRDLIRIRIFALDFFVDLLNSGCLDTMRITPREAGIIFDPKWRPKDIPPSDPTRHYRASIF